MQQFMDAKDPLVAAVSLQPTLKNALIELIDLLYQCDQIEDAKKWIVIAEQQSVNPAQTAFFKGLVLLKESKDPAAALASFEEAEKLDPSLAQTVKYQKAMAHMQMKKYGAAKDFFKQIVTREPGTDLAGFANEYIDVLTRKEDADRLFHGSLGYAVQYDTNVVFRPENDLLATNVNKDKDWRHVFTAQGDYTVKPTDKFSFKAGYSFYGTRQFDLHFYNMMSYDIPIQPTFNFNKVAVAFPMHYNYVTVNGKTYLTTVGLSNVNNFQLPGARMFQTQLQCNSKDYHWAIINPDDSKKGHETLAAVGIYQFFGKRQEGFMSLRYALNYEDTKGHNWNYVGNRVTFAAVVPLVEKLKWNFVADVFHQDFTGINSNYDKKRTDNVFTVSNLLAYEFMKNTELQLQYTHVYDAASIGVYKYGKDVYGVGAKYRF